MIGQENHEAQAENGANAAHRITFLNNTKDPNQVKSSQADMLAVEENFVSEVRSEVNTVMTTVGTGRSDDCNRKLGNF